jgi:putative heme-binding domain-containing protein
VQGKGLPVTDLEFGKDGAMYFTVGGRGTQAGLYRVSYTGAGTAEPMKPDAQHVAARKLRQSLEAFHGAENPQAIDAAWPHLGHEDRFIRYAARLAVEAQPVAQWRDRALKEQNPRAALTALLALARAGSKADQEPLLQALTRFPLDQLDEEWKLNKLRTVELSFIRQGRPSDEFVRAATEKLSKQFPAQSYALNRELSQLLVFLEASDAIEKTLQLLTSSAEPAEQISFAYVLREAKGWTPQQREKYFAWFNQAREYQGGNSFAKFILRIRDQALAKLSETERTALAAILDAPAAPKPAAAPAAAREFVKAWSMQELTPELEKVGSGRSFARGKELYAAAQCAQCHQFGTQRGGNIGPEITAVSNRFNRHDLLESILDPSKAISEQYASYILTLKGGETVMGQIVAENNDIYTVVTDPIAGTRREIGKSVVISREMSPASLMPPGLLNTLSKDEILDLLAYLESAGNEKAPVFSGN